MKLGRSVEANLHRYRWDDMEERCGIITRARWGMSFIEVPNRHPEPQHRFLIRAGDVVRVMVRRDQDEELIGYFHTHPGDQSMRLPSTRDFFVAGKHRELLHAMYHPWSHSLTWF